MQQTAYEWGGENLQSEQLTILVYVDLPLSSFEYTPSDWWCMGTWLLADTSSFR